MELRNIPLSKKDFDESKWQTVITNCESKQCYTYSKKFFQLAQETEAQGKDKEREIFLQLSWITSLMLQSSSKDKPFVPMGTDFKLQTRSADIEDFNDDQLDIYKEILSNEVFDPEIRARLADVLWERRRDYTAATIAVDSYLMSSINLEDPHEWPRCFERIERAIMIAVSLGKNTQYFEKVVLQIESLLDKYNLEEVLAFPEKLIRLLLNYKKGDSKKYAALSEKLARNCEEVKDWNGTRAYWELCASWHSLDKNIDANEIALINVAESFVNEAAAITNREQPNYLFASSHLQHAIQVYRKIGDKKERIEELHRELLKYQKGARQMMQTFSTKFDVSSQAKEAVKQITGKSFVEAIFELCLMIVPPRMNDLRKEVTDLAEKFPLQFLIQGVIVDDEGKVVAKHTGMFTDNPETLEKAMRERMYQQAKVDHNLIASSIIEPIRQQINLEYNAQVQDFFQFIFNNPLVPKGREHILTQGFHAGLKGDYVTATHLLIPQFEHAARYILKKLEKITSGLDSQGIQDERSLNNTLYDPELEKIFGEDLIFDFQGLLVERFGSNLRNRMAHGLMPNGAFYSFDVVYLWGALLRIYCLPLFNIEQKNTSNEDNAVALAT